LKSRREVVDEVVCQLRRQTGSEVKCGNGRFARGKEERLYLATVEEWHDVCLEKNVVGVGVSE